MMKAVPVANEITIQMILVLIVMASWAASVIDINGAFLNGELDEHVNCYLEVPEGFKKYNLPNVMLSYALEDSVRHDSGSLCILDYVSQCFVAHEVQQE
jgi:hypothetical protein